MQMIIPQKARIKICYHRNGTYARAYVILFTNNFKPTQAIKYILRKFPYMVHYKSNFIKILLNGILGSIYLFFIFILMADDLSLSLSVSEP
jgi:hypothetical protein